MAKDKHKGGQDHQASAAVTQPDPAAVTETTQAAPAEVAFTHGKKIPVEGTYNKETPLSWNITKNPRMQGRATYDRFQKYFGANTVGEYMEKGGTKGDLLWDLRSGFLSIEGVKLGADLVPRKPKVPPKPKAPKAVKEPKASKVAGPTENEVAAAVNEEVV